MPPSPWVDRDLGGELTLVFSDGFETGKVSDAEGGKWPELGDSEIDPFAQMTVKHAGAWGVELRCGALLAGKTWGSHDTGTTQGGPKMGIWRTRFDRVNGVGPSDAAYPYQKGTAAVMEAWYFYPADYPALRQGGSHGNYLPLTQLKGTGELLHPLLNIVVGNRPGDPGDDVRFGYHIRPTSGFGAGRVFIDGPAAVIPKSAFFNIVQAVVPGVTDGEWWAWLNGVLMFSLTGIDTVRDAQLVNNLVNDADSNGYIFYPFNNFPIGSTLENFSLIGDEVRIWALIGGTPSGAAGTTNPEPPPTEPAEPSEPPGSGPVAGPLAPPLVFRGSGRSLSPEVVEFMFREHKKVQDLMYLGFVDRDVFLALGSQPVRFARPGIDTTEQTWEKTGGAIIPGPIVESPQFSEQGQDVQFVVIDPGFDLLGRILNTRLLMRTYQLWRVYLHDSGPEAGKIGAWWMPCGGYLDGGFDVEETVDEEGRAPGALICRFRVTSPLGVIGDLRRSIQTNERSHQKWYPGDLAMTQVRFVQNRRTYFGQQSPDSIKGGKVE